MIFQVPAQRLALQPCDNDGRYIGELQIGGAWLQVEAYALDTSSETTEVLRGDVDRLAGYGEPLETIQIDGRDCLLVVFPKSK